MSCLCHQRLVCGCQFLLLVTDHSDQVTQRQWAELNVLLSEFPRGTDDVRTCISAESLKGQWETRHHPHIAWRSPGGASRGNKPPTHPSTQLPWNRPALPCPPKKMEMKWILSWAVVLQVWGDGAELLSGQSWDSGAPASAQRCRLSGAESHSPLLWG